MRRIGVTALVYGWMLLLAGGMIVSAEDKLKKDRLNMAKDVGIIAIGTARGNVGVALLGSAKLGVDTFKYRRHIGQAQEGQSGATTSSPPGQAESLLPVPQRPGYYYYPSNPNQLYVDPAQAAEPMKARIRPVEAPTDRITVRIANTAKDGRSINYTVDGATFSIAPGTSQTLDAAPGAVISYDRGDRPGAERYSLVEGTYEFRSVDAGWHFYNLNPGRTVAARTGESTPSTSVPSQGPSAPR